MAPSHGFEEGQESFDPIRSTILLVVMMMKGAAARGRHRAKATKGGMVAESKRWTRSRSGNKWAGRRLQGAAEGN